MVVDQARRADPCRDHGQQVTAVDPLHWCERVRGHELEVFGCDPGCCELGARQLDHGGRIARPLCDCALRGPQRTVKRGRTLPVLLR